MFCCEAETLCKLKAVNHTCNKRKIVTNQCQELTSSELRTEPRADRLQRTQSSHRLSSQHLAAVPTPYIAELYPTVFFFCPQPWFLRRSAHIFPGKKPCLFQSNDDQYTCHVNRDKLLKLLLMSRSRSVWCSGHRA